MSLELQIAQGVFSFVLQTAYELYRIKRERSEPADASFEFYGAKISDSSSRKEIRAYLRLGRDSFALELIEQGWDENGAFEYAEQVRKSYSKLPRSDRRRLRSTCLAHSL